MLAKLYLISMVAAFFSADLDTYNKKGRITVVGKAIEVKHDAMVQTDDGRRYSLDGVYEWGDEYYGKRVKVTGKLIIKQYPRESITDSISMIPQQRIGTWRIIKKPKWSLVE